MFGTVMICEYLPSAGTSDLVRTTPPGWRRQPGGVGKGLPHQAISPATLIMWSSRQLHRAENDNFNVCGFAHCFAIADPSGRNLTHPAALAIS
jgi:hypothetical protein